MTERDETWKPIPGASKYEVSDKGRVRRVGDGYLLAQSVKKGYWQVKYTDDNKVRQSKTTHTVVLRAHAGEPAPGQESCHGKAKYLGAPLNWYPENLRWDTRSANETDKDERPQPTFPCRNAPTCGNLNMKEGRRCGACSDAAGRQIARMLDAKMNLAVAAARFDLGTEWAFKIAVKGGYAGTKRQAELQQPSVTDRLRITLRDRQRGGWGDGARRAGDAA